MTIFVFSFFLFLSVGVIDPSLSFGVTKVSQSIIIGASLLQEVPSLSSEISESERGTTKKGRTSIDIIHTYVHIHVSFCPNIGIFF